MAIKMTKSGPVSVPNKKPGAVFKDIDKKLSSPALVEAPQKTQEQKDKENIATFGTAHPTESQKLQLAYAAQHGGLEKRQSATGLNPEISQTTSTAELQAQAQARKDLANQLKNVPQGDLGLAGANPLDLAVAAGAGIVGAAGGAGVGAGIGAGVGSIIPGVGTAVGAGIGGVIGGGAGFAGGFLTKISSDKKQNVKEAYFNYNTAKVNMGKILNNLKTGKTSKQQAIQDWQAEKQIIYAAQRDLKRRTQDNLQEFLGKPKDELIRVESFIRLMDSFDQSFVELASNPEAIVPLTGFESELEVTG